MKKILKFEVEENDIQSYCSPKNCPIFNSCNSTDTEFMFGIDCSKYNLKTLKFIEENEKVSNNSNSSI